MFREKHGMNQTLPDNAKPQRRWLLLAAVFLALFMALTPPTPAAAQACCANVATQPTLLANLTQLGVIGSILQGILTFMEGLQKVLFQTGFSSITANATGNAMMQANALYSHGTFVAQSQYQGIWNGQVAKLQSEATPPDQSTACPTISDAQNYNMQRDMMNKAQRGLQAASAGICKTGVTPVACQAQLMGQLCTLGMLPVGTNTSYGSYTSGCKQDPNFTDAAVSSWYNCGPIGMLVPDNVQLDTKTGMLDFSQITQGNGDCRTDGRCFAAAVLHCELLELRQMTSTSGIYGTGGQPPPQQVMAKMIDDLATTSQRVGDYGKCMQEIGKRAICGPSSSQIAASAVGAGGGGGQTCAQMQQQACKTLATQPAAGAATGTGGDGGGMGIQTSDVQNCAGGQTGMSILEQDRDRNFAPCLDTNYGTNIAPSHDNSDNVQQNANQCRQKLSDWYDKIGQCSNDTRATVPGEEAPTPY
jgi:hypothetical protein